MGRPVSALAARFGQHLGDAERDNETTQVREHPAFRGALPFPQFLAFIAIGIAALVHRMPTVSTSTSLRWPCELRRN